MAYAKENRREQGKKERVGEGWSFDQKSKYTQTHETILQQLKYKEEGQERRRITDHVTGLSESDESTSEERGTCDMQEVCVGGVLHHLWVT